MHVLIIANCVDTEHECLYSPCTELYFPGTEMSLKTISQRVSPDQGCYSVCIGYQYYRVVTVLEIGFMVCSPTYLAILHCTLKMRERADILSYIFTITQTVQNGSDCGLFCLRTRVVCSHSSFGS